MHSYTAAAYVADEVYFATIRVVTIHRELSARVIWHRRHRAIRCPSCIFRCLVWVSCVYDTLCPHPNLPNAD